MNKTLLVFKHEFKTTLRRTGFIIMTLVVPLIGILGIVISQIISGASGTSAAQLTNVGYVDEVGGFTAYTQQGNVNLVPYSTVAKANEALDDKTIKEYITITPDYLNTGLVNLYTLASRSRRSKPAPSAS